jgi:hypothetical protein
VALVAATFVSVASAAPKPPVDLSRAGECDFIGEQDGSQCLLPFPDNYYTVRDDSTRTGRRIDLNTSAMPQNASGVPLDAEPYDLNDGFSPGQAIVVRVPGLDNPTALAATAAVPLNHLSRYRQKRAPVVVIDTKTGKRVPIWVEIDSNADTAEETAVLIHPAENLHQRHRYVVAMRRLEDAGGQTIPAPNGFRYYRDEIASGEKAINRQRDRFERIFGDLAAAGIGRDNLYLAWDFTVASDNNIARRLLYMRNDAFRQLGDKDLGDRTVKGSPPSFSVETVHRRADDRASGSAARRSRPRGRDGFGLPDGDPGDARRGCRLPRAPRRPRGDGTPAVA